jgi:BlaI family transcriptional regulator, penicillinase repressor
MRRKASLAPLGESEMELLELVWESGPASVADIHQLALINRQVAYTTIMSQLRKLADKGYLEFAKEGNAYIYSAARRPGEVRHSLLSNILDKVFGGSALEMVESLVKNESISAEDYAEMKRMIEEMELRQRERGGVAW